MGKKTVLGKGINALIPEYPETSSADEEGRQIILLNVEEIEPNPYQARSDFDEEHIEELKRSIEEKGVIQPITVNRVGQTYQLITGERRWRATKKAGYETIPAIIYEIDSSDLPTTDAWKSASDKGDWITKIRPFATNRSRIVYNRIA